MEFSNYYQTCFHNDRYINISDANIHVLSIAMRYGISVFEGIRLYISEDGDALVFKLNEHLSRLKKSLELVNQSSDSLDQIPEIISNLIKVNNIKEDSYIRISVSASTSGAISSISQSLLNISCTRMGRKKWLSGDSTMKVKIVETQRPGNHIFPYESKNISVYAGPRITLMETIAEGYDMALLTNDKGYIAEAPTATFMIIKDGVLITPPLNDYILDSITRRVVLDICNELQIPIEVKSISKSDISNIDEAFLCGTGIEFARIGTIDGFQVKDQSYTVTNKIIDLYFKKVRLKSILQC